MICVCRLQPAFLNVVRVGALRRGIMNLVQANAAELRVHFFDIQTGGGSWSSRKKNSSMKKGTMATIKIFQKTLSSSWKITIQEYDLRARRRRKASQRSGRVTCKMSVFNPKRHPRAPTRGAETIHGSARRTRGRKAPCPESLRAFRSPGFW